MDDAPNRLFVSCVLSVNGFAPILEHHQTAAGCPADRGGSARLFYRARPSIPTTYTPNAVAKLTNHAYL
jgi:hypothetical protein